MEIGNGIRYMRKEKGLKQYELAERLGISRTVLSFYETGRTLADWNTVQKLAKELDCTIGDIYRPAVMDLVRQES